MAETLRKHPGIPPVFPGHSCAAGNCCYVDSEYRPVGRRKWICDGRPVTREGVVYGLQQAGFSREEIRVWLRIAKKLYELEANGGK